MESLELENRVSALAEDMGLRLVSMNVTAMRQKYQIRILADAEDRNITIDECAKLSRTVGDLLDSFPHDFPDYKLEVSSPGLKSPLKDWQIAKNVGRKVQVRYRKDGKQVRLEGKLTGYRDSTIVVMSEQQEHQFPYQDLEGLFVQPEF